MVKLNKKNICHIIIEGHNEEQMNKLFEEIQNNYGLYDNCIIDTNLPKEKTILDKNNNKEFGNLIEVEDE